MCNIFIFKFIRMFITDVCIVTIFLDAKLFMVLVWLMKLLKLNNFKTCSYNVRNLVLWSNKLYDLRSSFIPKWGFVSGWLINKMTNWLLLYYCTTFLRPRFLLWALGEMVPGESPGMTNSGNELFSIDSGLGVAGWILLL